MKTKQITGDETMANATTIARKLTCPLCKFSCVKAGTLADHLAVKHGQPQWESIGVAKQIHHETRV